MYKCDNCGAQTEAGEKTKTFSQTRDKEYTHYRWEFDKKTKRKKKVYYTTTGYETVREMKLCPFCANMFNKAGEKVDGCENEIRFREEDQSINSRGKTIKRRSKVNNSRDRRLG